jgi:hypothetical protein
MTQLPYQVEPMKGRCAVTGRVLEEGEEFYTVLFEEGESFRREEYSLGAWSGPPEGCYCSFKTRVPVKTKRKKLLVDDDVLTGFFIRLAEETEPVRVQFRFVIALILMRKRRLKYEGSQMENGVEVWTMTMPRDHSAHRVVNPRLTDDQIEGVSRELSAILHGDMSDWVEAHMDTDSDEGTQVGERDAGAQDADQRDESANEKT